MKTIPHRTLSATAALAATSAALALASAPAAAATVFSLADGGQSLIRFDSALPGTVLNVGALSGAALQLDGLDFRPANGALYGYSSGTSGIYRIDTGTGATTLVSTSDAPVAGPAGIDFNPTVDRLRVVTPGDANRRINIGTGAALTDGALAYAAGDANVGVNPTIIDVAYTNNDNNPATATTLYYVDQALGILASTTNPNGGVLATIGSLGLGSGIVTGFDIFTAADGSNTAFLSASNGGTSSLFTVNLATGGTTLLGDISAVGLSGLAVTPVPEPASMLLAAVGGLVLLGLRRRSARA